MGIEVPTTIRERVVPKHVELEVDKLFRMVMKHEGSDLHLKVGLPPMMRLAGTLRQMQLPPLTEERMELLTLPMLSEAQAAILAETGGVDFAHVIGDEEGRFRVTLFRQRGRLSLVARSVKTEIPQFRRAPFAFHRRRSQQVRPGDDPSGRRDGQRQEHYHCFDAAIHQPHAAGAYRDHRRPDRVLT
jgi:hypothetical protein